MRFRTRAQNPYRCIPAGILQRTHHALTEADGRSQSGPRHHCGWELESLYSARYTAGFDRELVEYIEQLGETDQRTFARWCVHHAFDHAEISHIDWIAEGLDAMDKGRSRPDAFENGAVSRARPTAHPRIIRTINTGIPGSVDVIP